NYRPHAARPANQHVGAQQHHRAHRVDGQRLSNPRRVTPDQIELQLPRLIEWNADVCEFSEPGVYAVDRLVTVDGGFDGAARVVDASERAGIERHRDVTPCDGNDVSDREGTAVQRDGHLGHRGNLSAVGAGCT